MVEYVFSMNSLALASMSVSSSASSSRTGPQGPANGRSQRHIIHMMSLECARQVTGFT